MAPKKNTPKAKAAAVEKKDPAPKKAAAKPAAKEEPAAKKAKADEPKEAEQPKAEEPKAEEPKDEAMAEEPKEEEEKEKEKDDKKDPRPSVKDVAITYVPSETTLNVVPTNSGRALMALTDGGMQFLIAGARASVGVKAGRYFFEAKVIEALNLAEGAHQGRSRVPMPRQLVRVGFSLAKTSLILGDGEDGVCFDSEGFFVAEKKRTAAASRFGRDQVVGVLLNLDSKSPNANTVSLFCNGERVSEPMPLPEQLRGKALYPHVAFRNVTIQTNFGPQPLSPLPFKCRMIQEAAKADIEEAKIPAPKDGKHEVMFPVAFPDEGTFDWLDSFLEKNPHYVELSDRKILEWAAKSGVWKPASSSWKNSNDKPDYNFGLQHMDDFSIRRVINSMAPLVPRNYVVMEVKANLTEADRKACLKRFSTGQFKKVANVVMGEPSADYKKRVHKKLLEDKQTKAEAEWRAKKIEKERKKAMALRQKQLEEARKKAVEEAKKAEEETAKEEKPEGEAAEEGEGKEEAKTEEAEAKGEEKKEEATEEKKEEEKKEEETKEETKEEEKKEEEEEEEDEAMPEVELTDEEKKLNFRPPSTSDLTPHVLSTTFGQFCIPSKEEGFDEVRYEWQNEAKSKEYLKKWVLEKKVTSRIEDLQPSEWFKTKAAEFVKALQEWQTKLADYKEKKTADPAEKEAEAEGKKAEGEEKKEGEEESKNMDVDLFSLEDINDVGNGEPLYSGFSFEDWALLTLRFELHLLQLAFKKDANDPERIGIHESHLLFYYSRYFRKQLSPRAFGKESLVEVVDLVKEAAKVDPETRVLGTPLEEEFESLSGYVKQQEESRRKRQQRIDAGDETARLDFSLLQQQQRQREQDQNRQQWTPRGAKGEGMTVGGPVGGQPRLVPAWQSSAGKGSWGSGGKAGGGWQKGYQPRKGGGKKA